MWPFRHKWTKRMRQHRRLIRADEKLDREFERMVNWGSLTDTSVKAPRTAQEGLTTVKTTYPTSLSANGLLAHFLMSCYLYYVEDVCVLSDAEFDAITEELKARWGEVTHPHKDLISMDDLVAGTGYAIKYPNSLIGAARKWYKDSRSADAPIQASANEFQALDGTFEISCKDCE